MTLGDRPGLPIEEPSALVTDELESLLDGGGGIFEQSQGMSQCCVRIDEMFEERWIGKCSSGFYYFV